MVTSSNGLASQAGVEVMKEGGNAVDAAVATGFALAVVHSPAGNIGGGGFMLIRLHDGATHFIDYRETAPGAVLGAKRSARNTKSGLARIRRSPASESSMPRSNATPTAAKSTARS